MRIITFVNNKGGVGKTTSSQNVAAALHSLGYSVLLIDMDSQASLTAACGVNSSLISGSVVDFMGGRRFSELAEHLTNGLYLIPASNLMLDYQESLREHKEYPVLLRTALKRLNSSHPKAFEYVVIDCPPALNVFTALALTAAQRFYVPMQMEPLAFDGLVGLMEWITTNHLFEKFGGLFATRYHPNASGKLPHEVMRMIQKKYSKKLILPHIRQSLSLARAQGMGLDVFSFDPHSNGAEDYLTLARQIDRQMTQLEKSVSLS
ncbi:chromosome partitioning protein [Catalinimonas alkaloidigena]|uniref:Chromosome partitioning protein n=1 Tax=Catalinimonas alkaloidigena TaxID=1075417 RepID=A0A1G9V470_9BACT|nr:ParA family protein [Catalinimonas alkaloidigena]SDM66910.1 chromosome partitioning protein [Catalinimonas alkaloidigena]